MKQLILLALIPAMVGCANLNKQQGRILGAAVGAFAAYQLGQGHKDKDWATVPGALVGVIAVDVFSVFDSIFDSRNWSWPF